MDDGTGKTTEEDHVTATVINSCGKSKVTTSRVRETRESYVFTYAAMKHVVAVSQSQ